MDTYGQRRRWLDCIGLLDGSYRIGWIVSYRLDRIVSDGLYRIGSIVSYRLDRILSTGSYQEKTSFYALSGYWLDGTDGLDGTLVHTNESHL